jgi:hypothetical protein
LLIQRIMKTRPSLELKIAHLGLRLVYAPPPGAAAARMRRRH